MIAIIMMMVLLVINLISSNSNWTKWSTLQVVTGLVISSNISNTRDSVSSGYLNTEKRAENTTRSGVFLTKFEVFG